MSGDKEREAAVSAVSLRMVLYGQFLLATGAYGYYMSGFEAKAKHGAFMGLGGDVLMCVMAAMSSASSKPLMMIGIHLGMILPALFAGVFAWQATKQGPEQAARFRLFVLMAVGSVAALYAIVSNKPPSPSKDKAK
eukprot:m.420591 g.420591  ORF g.420591 m.420591 type:complete len:136 (+) comp16846_c2_seq19:314-721(+)